MISDTTSEIGCPHKKKWGQHRAVQRCNVERGSVNTKVHVGDFSDGGEIEGEGERCERSGDVGGPVVREEALRCVGIDRCVDTEGGADVRSAYTTVHQYTIVEHHARSSEGEKLRLSSHCIDFGRSEISKISHGKFLQCSDEITENRLVTIGVIIASERRVSVHNSKTRREEAEWCAELVP